MDKFHRLVLEEFKGWECAVVWTNFLANGLWYRHRNELRELGGNNKRTLTAAVRQACHQLAADGYLTERAPRWRGDKWTFALTDAGRDELDENNTHCLFCDRLIKPGDPCHHGGGSAAGEVACEACAPTWADIREPGFWCDHETGEPVSPEQVEADIAAHIAAGGKITDRIVQPY